MIAAYTLHETVGGGGPSHLFDFWLADVLDWTIAIVCMIGALRAERSRPAWILASLALVSWAIGDTIWSLRFADFADAPYTTISDVFWLGWYPLMLAALILLVRDRVPGFELHRWIDGLVVMLIIATPWLAAFIEPLADRSGASSLTEVVEIAYPLGDFILVGSVIGVFALMGWRPGRMWLMLAIGLSILSIADSIYAASALTGSYRGEGIVDPIWGLGAALIAYAAWLPHPGRLEPVQVYGMRAVALPLAAQALAVGIQVYAYFEDLQLGERVLTIIVLLIAIVQIIVARPLPPPPAEAHSPPAAEPD
jgi:hypothetical protein